MTHENIKVSLPAQIVKVETLADNGFKVVVVTNELLPEQAAFLFSLKGSAGWVLFAPNRLKEEDIPPEAEKYHKAKKTPWRAFSARYTYTGTSARRNHKHSTYFCENGSIRRKQKLKYFFQSSMNKSENLYNPDFQKKILEKLRTMVHETQILNSDFFVDFAYKDETEKIDYYKKLNLPIYIVDLPKPELFFSSGKKMPCEDRQYYRHQKNNS